MRMQRYENQLIFRILDNRTVKCWFFMTSYRGLFQVLIPWLFCPLLENEKKCKGMFCRDTSDQMKTIRSIIKIIINLKNIIFLLFILCYQFSDSIIQRC